MWEQGDRTHGSSPARGNVPGSEACWKEGCLQGPDDSGNRRSAQARMPPSARGLLPQLLPLTPRPGPRGPLSSRPCLSPANTIWFLDMPCTSTPLHHRRRLRPPRALCPRSPHRLPHSQLPQPLSMAAGVTGLRPKQPLAAQRQSCLSGAGGGIAHTKGLSDVHVQSTSLTPATEGRSPPREPGTVFLSGQLSPRSPFGSAP